MSFWLIAGIAVMTYGSRALALVLMPDPSPHLRSVLDRIPAPLFAALAAVSLFDGGGIADTRTLMATAGAVALTWTRSMLLVLLGGLVGYGAAVLLI
jgi:branched-subunit amino acid transport protein